MSADVAPLIRCQQLSKAYAAYDSPRQRLRALLGGRPGQGQGASFWALQDLGFELRRGQALGVIGRNGAGKSTLLQLLCGTLTPTSGELQVNGRIAALLELGAGFNPDFTGIENVYLNAAILGLSRAETEARLDAILAYADIGDFVHQPVKNYSSGMFLRLAFAVVAHVDADVLIIDEALAVGDALFAQKCMRFLRNFRERGALLLVSHDIPSVTSLCDEALWLERGRMRMLGSARAVTEAYLEAIYAEQQAVDGLRTAGDSQRAAGRSTDATAAKTDYHDMRRDLLLASPLRNDIELRPFEVDSRGFGSGQVKIAWVGLHDEQGQPLAWVVGGENVMLEVRLRALAAVDELIVGFLLKDRLGQVLFGENTLLMQTPLALQAGEEGVARFRFRLPYLPSGDYALSVGVAGGTQDEHVQHHWLHEALSLSCVASHVTHGLMGVAMQDLAWERRAPASDDEEGAA